MGVNNKDKDQGLGCIWESFRQSEIYEVTVFQGAEERPSTSHYETRSDQEDGGGINLILSHDGVFGKSRLFESCEGRDPDLDFCYRKLCDFRQFFWRYTKKYRG